MDNFTGYVQDGIIKLMIKDGKFLRTSKSLIEPEIFDSRIRIKICTGIYGYFDLYGKNPDGDFRDFTRTFVKDKEDKKLCNMYLDRLDEFKPNRKYIISRLTEWLQYQRITKAVLKSAVLVKSKKYEEVRSTMLEAFRVSTDTTELGDDFFNYKYKEEEEDIVCRTLIPELDARIKGYGRGELFLWLAPTNVGKSWALVEGARAVLQQGFNIVFYTLEMSKQKILDRLAMSVSGLRKDERRGQRRLTMEYFNGETIDFSKRKTLKSGRNTLDFSINKYKLRGGSLTVKEGKEGEFTVRDIEAHLNQLELNGIMPDIIFIDYADLMVSEREYEKSTDQIDHVFVRLHGLSKERNIGVVSAAQGNRQALQARRVTLYHISQWIGKANKADVVISINQTEDELARQEMRLFAAKVREGDKWFTINIKYNFSVGQFILESRMERREENEDGE